MDDKWQAEEDKRTALLGGSDDAWNDPPSTVCARMIVEGAWESLVCCVSAEVGGAYILTISKHARDGCYRPYEASRMQIFISS